jgi:hypothetical protein
MASQSREFLLWNTESALNTPTASPVVYPTSDYNAMYIPLIDGNAFTPYAKPVIEEIPYGGGVAITAEAVSDHYEAVGQLKVKLWPGMAQLLLGWALSRINTGQTSPWTTTQNPGDLASASMYHGVQRSDGSILRKLYSGCKVSSLKLEVSRQSTTCMATFGIIASQQQGNSMDSTSDPTGTPFPIPTETQLSYGSPYTFKQTAGNLIIATSGSTARTEYEDVSVTVNNVIDGRWFEQSYRQVLQFCGRQTGLDTTLYYKPTPDDRTNMEAIAVHAASLAFTGLSTGLNLALQFNAQNTILDLPFDLPLNQAFMTKLSLRNRFDPSAGQDISFAMS